MNIQRATLVYDGECRFCIASQKILRRFVGWRLRSTPFQAPHALQLHPQLTAQVAQSRLHLVVEPFIARNEARNDANAPQLFAGMEAVAQTLALRPVGKIALIYYFPLLRQLADALYGWVARHRYQLFGRVVGGCENGSCEIPRPK